MIDNNHEKVVKALKEYLIILAAFASFPDIESKIEAEKRIEEIASLLIELQDNK